MPPCLLALLGACGRAPSDAPSSTGAHSGSPAAAPEAVESGARPGSLAPSAAARHPDALLEEQYDPAPGDPRVTSEPTVTLTGGGLRVSAWPRRTATWSDAAVLELSAGGRSVRFVAHRAAGVFLPRLTRVEDLGGGRVLLLGSESGVRRVSHHALIVDVARLSLVDQLVVQAPPAASALAVLGPAELAAAFAPASPGAPGEPPRWLGTDTWWLVPESLPGFLEAPWREPTSTVGGRPVREAWVRVAIRREGFFLPPRCVDPLALSAASLGAARAELRLDRRVLRVEHLLFVTSPGWGGSGGGRHVVFVERPGCATFAGDIDGDPREVDQRSSDLVTDTRAGACDVAEVRWNLVHGALRAREVRRCVCQAPSWAPNADASSEALATERYASDEAGGQCTAWRPAHTRHAECAMLIAGTATATATGSTARAGAQLWAVQRGSEVVVAGGDGQPRQVLEVEAGEGACEVRVGDLDRDGAADLAVLASHGEHQDAERVWLFDRARGDFFTHERLEGFDPRPGTPVGVIRFRDHGYLLDPEELRDVEVRGREVSERARWERVDAPPVAPVPRSALSVEVDDCALLRPVGATSPAEWRLGCRVANLGGETLFWTWRALDRDGGVVGTTASAGAPWRTGESRAIEVALPASVVARTARVELEPN